MYPNDQKNQEKSKQNAIIRSILDENNENSLNLLNEIIYLSTRFRTVFISQGTLAAKFKLSREQVNKLLARWKELDVLRYRQQGFNRSCIYFLNPIINLEKNRFKYKLSAAALLLSVSSLCSAVFQGDFTLSNIRNYIYRNSLILKSINQSLIFKNQSSTPSYYDRYLLKEKVMNAERPIINQIKDKFRLPEDQMSFFQKHSDIVLQDAIRMYDEISATKSIKSPVGYFRRIVDSAKERHDRKAEKGRMGAAAKKIVNSTFNANHSPEVETSKVSKEERITYILKEIASYEKHLRERRGWLKDKAFGGEYLIAIAENAIANYKRELAELHYSPDTIVCDAPRERISDPAELEYRLGDREYEEHLHEISKDKSDPSGYKDMVRRYDYRRTLRKA